MRLVLLPGMNGSSTLFGPLLDALAGIDCQVINLPAKGSQDLDYPACTYGPYRIAWSPAQPLNGCPSSAAISARFA